MTIIEDRMLMPSDSPLAGCQKWKNRGEDGKKEQIRAQENYLSIIIRILILAYGGRPSRALDARRANSTLLRYHNSKMGKKNPSRTKIDSTRWVTQTKRDAAVVCIRISGG